jgi:hypothetical protein
VSRTPFLSLDFWRNPRGHPGWTGTTSKSVDILITTKEAVLANSNWLYQRAVDTKVFEGTSSSLASDGQRQAIADVLNSFGWNAGRKPKVTPCLQPNAWWLGRTQGTFIDVSTGQEEDEEANRGTVSDGGEDVHVH